MRNLIENTEDLWKIRMALAYLGWQTSAEWKIEGDQYWFRAEVNRWDWYGRGTDCISFYSLNKTQVDNTEDFYGQTVEKFRLKALQALDAWDIFKSSVPMQDSSGKTVVNSVATKYAFNTISHVEPKEPWEDLPYPDILCNLSEKEVLGKIVILLKQGISVKDHLNPWASSNNRREERSWQYQIQCSPTTWHGQRVLGRDKYSTDNLFTSSRLSFISGIISGYYHLLEIYSPGSQIKHPPHYLTIEESIVRIEWDQRRKDCAQLEQNLNQDRYNRYDKDLLLQEWKERRNKSNWLIKNFREPTLQEIEELTKKLDPRFKTASAIRKWNCIDQIIEEDQTILKPI